MRTPWTRKYVCPWNLRMKIDSTELSDVARAHRWFQFNGPQRPLDYLINDHSSTEPAWSATSFKRQERLQPDRKSTEPNIFLSDPWGIVDSQFVLETDRFTSLFFSLDHVRWSWALAGRRTELLIWSSLVRGSGFSQFSHTISLVHLYYLLHSDSSNFQFVFHQKQQSMSEIQDSIDGALPSRSKCRSFNIRYSSSSIIGNSQRNANRFLIQCPYRMHQLQIRLMFQLIISEVRVCRRQRPLAQGGWKKPLRYPSSFFN